MPLLTFLAILLSVLAITPILFPKLFINTVTYVLHKNAVLIVSGFIIGNGLTALLFN